MSIIAVPATIISEFDNLKNGSPEMRGKAGVNVGIAGLGLIPGMQIPAFGAGVLLLAAPDPDSSVRMPSRIQKDAAREIGGTFGESPSGTVNPSDWLR